MPKYQVDILLAAWQDIDRISDFHLKMVGAASAEKITDHILDTLAKLASFPYVLEPTIYVVKEYNDSLLSDIVDELTENVKGELRMKQEKISLT